MRRLRSGGDTDSQSGVYAILYAALVVVLIAFAAIVVDLSSVRQDRRLDRSAADAAALGGAAFLDPNGGAANTPYAACRRAWDYLATTLVISVPASACNAFSSSSLSPCPASEIDDDVVVGNRTVRVAWPIPQTGGSGFLNPDLAPGRVTQPFSTTTDGGSAGCDRLGVAIFQNQGFGLAGAFGATGTSTQVHSVARVVPTLKQNGEFAALNILNQTTCSALSTSGQGKVIVNRSLAGARGIIAVESDGSGCGNGASAFVISVPQNSNFTLPATGNAEICASGPAQAPTDNATPPNALCDGQGRIEAFALDGSYATKAYNGAPNGVTSGYNLYPTPVSEGGIQQWSPVTSIYGCNNLPLTPPSAPVTQSCASSPPYVATLYSKLDSASPQPYTSTAWTSSYSGVNYGAFQTLSDGQALGPATAVPAGLGVFNCVQTSSTVPFYVPPGDWYVDCKDGNNSAGFQPGSKAIFGGGQIVFRGGIKVGTNNACFTINTPITSLPAAASSLPCPTAQNTTNEQATTSPAPTQEAIVMIRGNQGFSNGSSNTKILLPQTLVAQAGNGPLNLGGGSGTLLWTAPGGGTITSGNSTLATLCTVSGKVDTTCEDSHFYKTAYWNESNTQTMSIKGQGSLSLVGTFFAPRLPFTFDGQGSYFATNAQFWVDTLAIAGQGGLGLTPDTDLGFFRKSYSVALIR